MILPYASEEQKQHPQFQTVPSKTIFVQHTQILMVIARSHIHMINTPRGLYTYETPELNQAFLTSTQLELPLSKA